MAVEEKDLVEAIGRHKEDIAKVEGRLDAHDIELKRHDQLINNMTDMQRSIDKLANTMEKMVEEQKQQSIRLTALEQKPAKKWDNLINVIIAGLASGLLGYVIAQIFE